MRERAKMNKVAMAKAIAVVVAGILGFLGVCVGFSIGLVLLIKYCPGVVWSGLVFVGIISIGLMVSWPEVQRLYKRFNK